MLINSERSLIRVERVERVEHCILNFMKLPRVESSESGRTPEMLDEFEQRH